MKVLATDLPLDGLEEMVSKKVLLETIENIAHLYHVGGYYREEKAVQKCAEAIEQLSSDPYARPLKYI